MNPPICMAVLAVSLLAMLSCRADPSRAASAVGTEASGRPGRIRVTCSWDDAHVHDVRVADLMRRYRAKGTFYIYPENYVIAEADPTAGLKRDPFLIVPFPRFIATYADMEIGAHGYHHRNMDRLSPADLAWQLSESRRVLEQWFGRTVVGMAYPGGGSNPEVRVAAAQAGYRYARTTDRSRPVLPIDDPFALRSTVRFNDADFWDRYEYCKVHGDAFHFTGHSAYITSEAAWMDLEAKFKRISEDPDVVWVTNGELVQAESHPIQQP